MLHYILQVIVFQLLFLLAFELFLKKETFFSYNRIYLLVTPVLAMLLPLFEVPMLQNAIPAESFFMLPEVSIGGDGSGTSRTAETAAATSQGLEINWWWITYSTGFAVSFMLFINKYRSFRSLLQHSSIAEDKDLQIIQVPDSHLAFTFFNTIFVGDQIKEDEISQILSHEKVHVRQKHSIDLLFFELLKILFWFNPLIYIYQSRISMLHEFIADARVIQTVEKKTYYQQLLNTAFKTENISFINQFFNHSLIRKRIVMLQKSKSKSISQLRYLILIPLMLAMLTYVSCSQETDDKVLSEQESEVLNIEVEDFSNQTPEEREMVKQAINQITEASDYKEVVVTDGTKSLTFKVDPTTGKPNISISNISGASNQRKIPSVDTEGSVGDVPFAVIEEVPVFPGCEGLASNEERKACMSQKVTEFVNRNFNTSLGRELGLTGINRIYVQFRINHNGGVDLLGARAPHPALQEEAERIVNLLPQMTPGKQRGQEVGVLYSLPISFRVGE